MGIKKIDNDFMYDHTYSFDGFECVHQEAEKLYVGKAVINTNLQSEKMKLKIIGRIWKDFKPIHDAMKNLRNRGCWIRCFQCEKEWKEIETEYVHMTTNEEGDTRFLCGTCLVLHQK